MHYKKPYELVDGDVVDMIPVIDALEGDYDTEVPLDTRSVAECVYFVVQDEPTPWAAIDGRNVNVTPGNADGVEVFFENGDSWFLPTELDIPVMDHDDA